MIFPFAEYKWQLYTRYSYTLYNDYNAAPSFARKVLSLPVLSLNLVSNSLYMFYVDS